MRIVVLKGSPNKRGSSNLLAEEFIRGAKEAGYTVEMIDAAHANLHLCTGCVHCGYEGPCVQKDDMELFRKQILSADMLVFVTPLYYYGMSAQLKILVDRFCAINSSIHTGAFRGIITLASGMIGLANIRKQQVKTGYLVQLCINLEVIVLDIRVSCASLNRRRSGLRLG